MALFGRDISVSHGTGDPFSLDIVISQTLDVQDRDFDHDGCYIRLGHDPAPSKET